MESDIGKLKSTLDKLLKVRCESTEQNIKNNLIKEFKIPENTTSIVWKKDDYDNAFKARWLNHLYSKILETSEKDLFLHLNMLKPLIETVSDYSFEGDDYIKFVLCFIVDSLNDFGFIKINFLKQKLTKLKDKIGDRDFSFYKNLKSAYSDIIHKYKKYLNEFNIMMPDKFFKDKIKPLKLSLDDNFDYFFSKNEITESGLNNFSECLEKNYNNVLEEIENYNQALTDDFYKIKESEELMLEFKHCYNRAKACLVDIKEYENAKDFVMDRLDFNITDDFKSFLRMTYSKNVPYKQFHNFNECEVIITDLIKDESFKKLFQDICESNVVRTFYNFEENNYFTNEQFKNYYCLLDNFPFFWNRVKVIPLPETIVGVTTDMLVIYINSIQKKFFNIKNEEEKMTVKLIFNIVN
jgi:hypothetical protein